MSENILILRDSSDLSGEISDRYKELREVDNSNVITVSYPDKTILDNEDEFNVYFESDIQSNLNTNIEYIVCCGDFPLGFYDGSDVISLTSRISRINETYSKKESNKYYNYRTFNQIPNTYLYKSSIINSKTILDNVNIVFNSPNANGVFLYGDSSNNVDSSYENDLNLFKNNLLNELGLNVPQNGTFNGESLINFVENDSFYWGVTSKDTNSSYFKNTSFKRMFFYNADNNSGLENNLAQIALSSGYVSSSGALSNPSYNGHLRPFPFFLSLLNGLTVGESYIYSLPFLNWTNVFYGDPLLTFSFNRNTYLNNPLNEYINAIDNISKSYSLYRNKNTNILLDKVIENEDIETATDLITISNDIKNKYQEENLTNVYNEHFNELIDFIEKDTDVLDINKLMNDNNMKFKNYINDIYNANEEVLLREGQWEQYIIIGDYTDSVDLYHFEILFYDDFERSNLIKTIDSELDQNGWEYEYIENRYINLDPEGVKSNYVGMNVLFRSSEVDDLEEGKRYYLTIKQKNSTTDLNSFNEEIVI